MFKVVVSVIKSALKGVWQDPEVQKLKRRHPKAAHFLRQRLTPDQVFGLHLTVGVIFTAIFIYFFFGIVEDLIGLDPLIQADLRISNLLQILRGGYWNSIMLFATYLGKAEIIFTGLFCVAVLLFLRRRWHYFVALIVSGLGGEAFVWLIKNIVERQRPPLTHALLPEAGYSFPSGHAFVAMSFYGLAFYFWWRATKGRLARTMIILLGLIIIMAIGFSRIYLGVHWPSDVLASYASGAAWLTVIITTLEMNRKFFRRGEGEPLITITQARVAGGFLAAIWLGFVWAYFVTHPLPGLNVSVSQGSETIMYSSIPARLFSFVPSYSEGLSGAKIEPINVVIVATPEQLKQLFTQAQWEFADQVSLHSLTRLTKAAIFGLPYPQAPGTPTFWDARANDFSVEQPTAANTIKERHHLHVWETSYVVPDGRRVWVGTAHFDQSTLLHSSLFIPTHVINPAVDKEREKIKTDLVATGMVGNVQTYQIVEPTLGKNISGSEFFTDGKAYIFWIK